MFNKLMTDRYHGIWTVNF